MHNFEKAKTVYDSPYNSNCLRFSSFSVRFWRRFRAFAASFGSIAFSLNSDLENSDLSPRNTAQTPKSGKLRPLHFPHFYLVNNAHALQTKY